tara:strand:- start:190 stop:336 length:147 start_codon:yes stop_codon:yes gene_type:complete
VFEDPIAVLKLFDPVLLLKPQAIEEFDVEDVASADGNPVIDEVLHTSA